MYTKSHYCYTQICITAMHFHSIDHGLGLKHRIMHKRRHHESTVFCQNKYCSQVVKKLNFFRIFLFEIFQHSVSIKMPKYCCVPECNSNSKCKTKRYFHYFPKNFTLRSLWIELLKIGRTPGQHENVCSDHLTEKDLTGTCHSQ